MNRRDFLGVISVGCSSWAWQPPGAGKQDETVNVSALIKDVLEHGKGGKLLTEYTYLMRLGERRTGNKGEVKETVEVYESYIPTLKTQGNTAAVILKVTEKGVPLSAEKVEKERQKAAAELLKAEAEAQKNNSRLPPEPSRSKGAYFTMRLGQFFNRDIRIDVRTLLQNSTFSGARRVTLEDRPAIALDFQPKNNAELDNEVRYLAQLAGTLWVDVQERILMRLEGWPREAVTHEAVTRTGKPALLYEQQRLPDGYWLPRRAELNCDTHRAVFGKLGVDYTFEFTDYKRFGAETQDVKIKNP
jgi:hypothetical protein